MRVVVIGNGMAGVAVVEEAHKLRPDLSVTIFGDEAHVNYNRILLSDVLAGTRTAESIVLNPLAWYEQHGIDLRLGIRVTTIDPAAKTVTDAAGGVTSYDHLLLAVGGSPFIPPITGIDKAGVFVFRTIEDCDRMLARAGAVTRAVVIGGGLLGLEAARGLINHGVAVTVVHLMEHVMEQQLDPTGGRLLKREIERMGIAVILKATAAEIVGHGEVTGVRLTTGEDLPAGMVLVCAGIRPNLALARAAGLQVNRGIVVDDRMQTSDPAIFAVGDAIEHRGKTYGLIAPIPAQALTVANAIAGDGTRRYEGTACATTLKVAGVHLTSAGDFLGRDGGEEIVWLDAPAGVYKKLVLRGNRLAGMILLGDNRDAARLSTLVLTGQDISAIKRHLIGPPSTGADEAAVSVVVSMADTDLICNCHTVTKGEIVTAIRGQGLTSRDQVAACTKASTGCGSCTELVEDLVRDLTGKTGAARPNGDAGKSAVPALTPPALPDEAGPLRDLPIAYPITFETERIKQEGLGLDFAKIQERGTRALSQDDYFRLKTYGVCSQKHPGYFMLRIRIPGGRVTAGQLRHLADLAETHGRGWGHLTIRQDLELHWVRVEEVPEIWERLDAIGLTTRSACGHTMRNVTACPHGGISPDALMDVQPWADAISAYFLARSAQINPVMPSRLNLYFAGCPDCAPDAQINDIGFVAVRQPGSDAIGWEVWVGGSLGAHPILGFRLRDWMPLEDALPACQVIFELYTKYGIRQKGKARLKFLIEQWGRERFIAQFDRLFEQKKALPENRTFRYPTSHDGEPAPSWPSRLHARVAVAGSAVPLPPGCVPQRQPGYVIVEIAVPLGEIRAVALRTLAGISRRYGHGMVHFTKAQNVELHWIKARNLNALARAVTRAGLSLAGAAAAPRVTACPGTEFCVLAITDAQGAGRGLLSRLASLDPDNSAQTAFLNGVTINISGCPNSCAKHQVADIGLAGALTLVGDEKRYTYQLYLGGRIEGGIQLGEVVRKGITEEMVVPTVETLIAIVREHRETGETFQAVIARLGLPIVAALMDERLAPFMPREVERVSMVTEFAEVAPELAEVAPGLAEVAPRLAQVAKVNP